MVISADQGIRGEEITEEVKELARWYCPHCEEMGQETASPKNYMGFVSSHSKAVEGGEDCSVLYMNSETKEVMANSLADARSRGFFPRTQQRPRRRGPSEAGNQEQEEQESPKGAAPRDNQPLLEGYWRTERVELGIITKLHYSMAIEKGILEKDAKGKYPTIGQYLDALNVAFFKLCLGLEFGLIETVAEGEG